MTKAAVKQNSETEKRVRERHRDVWERKHRAVADQPRPGRRIPVARSPGIIGSRQKIVSGCQQNRSETRGLKSIQVWRSGAVLLACKEMMAMTSRSASVDTAVHLHVGRRLSWSAGLGRLVAARRSTACAFFLIAKAVHLDSLF